ncbi:hypothetical protein BAUCODRAFT_148213 [Baudoinia panamericana UAMH 10762]|uniref:Large ribosomal subunit protein mL44 n=1 Tax=Baudoinia panamericana (strain UAMH 10762) TaxID=717646 RepID=M2MYG8_BAUPA|nr:uncharacterized protein BAUCODRAFT_148213 [Baudoinia panamericana UAMH 10762]EMC96633.1 hypothetical protein BAUCODRAFT_148213 [Baudoinia panamericana UAMH 10762]
MSPFITRDGSPTTGTAAKTGSYPTAMAVSKAVEEDYEPAPESHPPAPVEQVLHNRSTRHVAERPLYAPSHRKALHSAKLAALHARLSLPSKLPLQTLARCLIDSSADPRPGYNNAPLAILGQDLLGYYTAEYILCHYPRLPMAILFAAQYAYVGNATLAAMRSEWGVETVGAPGQEVEPGLLQLKRLMPGNAMLEGENIRVRDMPQARRLGSGRRNEAFDYRRGMSSRVVYDDQFGDLQTGLPPNDARPFFGAPISTPNTTSDVEGTSNEAQPQRDASALSVHDPPEGPQTVEDTEPTTVELASASFVRALAGALYLHAGATASKTFHKDHVLSRHVQLHTLFHFTHPTRDLSNLCKREGFEPPVARLISETGRLSRTPVFVVGVFSGEEKLGEAAGASLNEARIRAAAAALRSWYLYSPPETEICLPSDAEGLASISKGRGKANHKEANMPWKPQMIDIGEIIT